MASLYRPITVLFIVFVGLITASRLGGNSQPSSAVALFTSPDGTRCELPCLFGIRPRATAFNDALALLTAHPFLGTPQTYRQAFDHTRSRVLSFAAAWTGHAGLSGQELSVTVYQDDEQGLVSGLALSVEPACSASEAEISLGAIMNVLGAPSLTLDRNGILDRRFFFRGNGIMVAVAPRTGPDFQPGVYRPQPRDCVFNLTVESPSADPGDRRWCGFSRRSATCGG
jgi:hypothetical protein